MQAINTWKIKGLYKADVNDVLAELNNVSPDEITPKQVVDIAKSEDSVMHGFFEWDDSIAGQKYRENQASKMLRNIEIIHLDDEEKPVAQPVRYFEVNSSRTSTYVPTRLIMQDIDEYSKLLERAKNDLIAFQKRYATLTELDSIFEEIKNLLAS